MSALDEALQHAARGWRVFPCKPDKAPYTKKGKDDATAEPAIIQGWWARWPDALIGINCERSGLFALDIDIKNGRDGWRSFTELIATHGGGESVFVGPLQSTPSGGNHLIFRLPEGLKIPNTSDKLAPGLDLRSNGYICTGAGYEWLLEHGPETPLTDAPGWLLALIEGMGKPRPNPRQPAASPPDSSAAGAYWLNYYLQRVDVGCRNETGFALACQLRDSGLSEAEAEAVMLAYADSVPVLPGAPYSDREALASMRQAYRAPAREAARLPGVSGDGYHAPSEAPDSDFLFPDDLPAGESRQEAPAKQQPVPQIWSIADLMEAVFPELAWAVPGLIPAGLSLLGGRPKVGKSWLALQIAQAVGAGGRVLDRDVERGQVLYVALEDSPRRIKERAQKQQIPRDALIKVVCAWRPLHKGGLDDLLLELERSDYRLVIIDTLSRAFPGIDQKEQHEIGPYLDHIQKLALNRNIGIMFNDHTRKPNGFNPNPIDDIINSSGKTMPADGAMVLYREPGKPGARLMGTGREFEEFDLRLSWDRVFCCWQLEGDTSALQLTERRREILDILEIIGPAQVVKIAKEIGQPKSNTYSRLQDMTNAGMVVRMKIGDAVYYELPDCSDMDEPAEGENE